MVVRRDNFIDSIICSIWNKMSCPAMNPLFSIPRRYQDQLQHVPCTDTRTDTEIIHSLQSHAPITSEKNIWAYWHSGVADMPDWCQRNVASWVRMHDSSWTVRVLDNKPDSPNYALNILPASQFPDCFVEGTMNGQYIPQHSSDFVRGVALSLHGGVWLDVGCILCMNLDWIFWDTITSTTSPFKAAVPLVHGAIISNAVIACRKGDPFIRRWHGLFTQVWKGQTSCRGLMGHPELAYEQDPTTTKLFDNAIQAGFKVSRESLYEYLTQIMCWERLTQLDEDDGDFNPSRYWRDSIMKLQGPKELWGMEAYLPTSAGADQFELLTTPLDADPSSDQYQKAEGLVFHLLTESCMQKVGHAPGLTKTKQLGVVLDEDVTRVGDAGEGTFAALLRYGAENFAQTRKGPSLVE